jgi:hypothetical protein
MTVVVAAWTFTAIALAADSNATTNVPDVVLSDHKLSILGERIGVLHWGVGPTNVTETIERTSITECLSVDHVAYKLTGEFQFLYPLPVMLKHRIDFEMLVAGIEAGSSLVFLV